MDILDLTVALCTPVKPDSWTAYGDDPSLPGFRRSSRCSPYGPQARRGWEVSERGPTTRSLDERLDDLTADVHEVLSDVAGLRLDMTTEFGKLREDLGDFRLESERRFGSIEKVLSGIQEHLKFIRWVGVFFAGILVAAVAGAGHVVWDAATINAEVNHQVVGWVEPRFIEARPTRVTEDFGGPHAAVRRSTHPTTLLVHPFTSF